MWLNQVIVEYSTRTCDYGTLVHRPCKNSISSIKNIMGNSIEFFLNIHLGWTLSSSQSNVNTHLLLCFSQHHFCFFLDFSYFFYELSYYLVFSSSSSLEPHSWVLTIVSFERGYFSCQVDFIIVCKFGSPQLIRPLFLFMVNKDP